MRPEADTESNAGLAGSDDRRHAARLPQETLLSCTLGEILDLSRTGLRIRRKGMPRQSFIDIVLADGREQVLIKSEIVWIKKLGFRTYEMGLHFVEPSPADLQIISRFAMYNRFNRSM